MTAFTADRTDRAEAPDRGLAPARPARGWAVAGIGAAVAAIAGLVGSSGMTAVYDSSLSGDASAIADKMSTQTAQLLLFHVGTLVAVLLLPIFAAGLARRLAAQMPADSLVPRVASTGLLLVAVAGMLGTALDTEFLTDIDDPTLVSPESAVFFGHWVGTVPWVWVGAGLAALAVAVVALRHSAAPRWLGWVSLVFGGLIVLFGVSPLQYMAAMIGPLWLLVAAIGFFAGDRRTI